MAEIPLEGQAQVVGLIRPGDTLLVRVAASNSTQFDAIVAELRAAVKATMPGVELCFIAGVDELLVYRPDPTN